METVTNDKGEEKEICLELRFLDSIKFTLKSLDSLVSTLGDDQFLTLCDQMTECSEAQLKLLKQKGVFPYEFMTDFSKLDVTSLPSKKKSAHRVRYKRKGLPTCAKSLEGIRM
jgi:hypothetical protein